MKRSEKQKVHLAPPWKPGQSGNPKGRPKLTEAEKRARELDKREIAELWPELKCLTQDEIIKVANDQKQPILKRWFARNILFGFKNGDISEIHKMYDRTIGKPILTVEADIGGEIKYIMEDSRLKPDKE